MIADRIDEPRPGHFKLRLVRGGPFVPVRIYYGLPVIGGEVQDRAPRLCVELAGETDELEVDRERGYSCRVAIPMDRVWPYCLTHPITAAEYRFMLRRLHWAREHAPDHYAGAPRKRVNWSTFTPF